MITKAQARFIRITPRKFRQIIPLIKGRNPEEAIDILANVKKKASVYAIELLKSAVANAKRIQGVDPSNLYISRIIANCGPVLKRYRAASMGRAVMVKKRTSHIIIELDELKKPKEKVIPPKPDSKQKMARSRNELQKVRRRREKAKG
jgi:large subunit ribosomal protein L22